MTAPSFLYALVPIVGGLALIIGGSAALWVDRLDLLADSSAPKPVYIRYTSQATYALKKRPHWIFLASAVVFAPLIMVTATWQAQILLAKSTEEENYERLTNNLKWFANVTGISCVLVAAFPMGNTLGMVLHIIFAAATGSFGINYSVRAQELANEMNHGTLSTLREVVWIMGSVGGLLMVFVLFQAVTATEKLQKHEKATIRMKELEIVIEETPGKEEEKPEKSLDNTAEDDDQNKTDEEGQNKTEVDDDGSDILSAEQIQKHRLFEAGLAVGQISVALMLGIVLISAAAEVGEMSNLRDTIDDDNEALIVGLASTAAAVATAVGFRVFNNFFFNMCQAKSDWTSTE